jgi:hypothetical protein
LNGNTTKLARPFAGPYFIVEKPSELHAKLRRVNDNKLIKNKIHINRLKMGLLRSNEPIELSHPEHGDAAEPAYLYNDELTTNNIDNNSLTNDMTETVTPPLSNITAGNQNTHSTFDDKIINSQTTSKLYKVQKILRKKYYNNTWNYRIKWIDFPNSQNSWVEFNDLSPDLQTLVTSTHTKIQTDKRSQKKR